ncbi:peroxiredoxin [Lewinella sp. 4G2]|uniref:peroxiredoxin family protein n=1 Tax=Lewinella sp. 4G2 TaxID=1803372 RepID=UPI0007B46D53|nr:TlpA disulfide reductase family protein [Lewinella sp. 4G2]OAV43184.1 hypothetical protein A3850_001140 [Lewinella sp. 4G2]
MKKYTLLLLLFIATLNLTAQSTNEASVEGDALAFELVDMDGNVVSSENTRGKVVVLNFWFIGCKPCLEEIPEINAVYESYRDNPDVIFASIGTDSAAKITKNRTKYNIQYPVVADGRAVCQQFGVEGFPTNMVIDREGNYELNFTGGFAKIGKVIDKAIARALK